MSATWAKEIAEKGPQEPPAPAATGAGAGGNGGAVGTGAADEGAAPERAPRGQAPRRQDRAFFRSRMDRLFPTAHRIKIRKRGDDGELRAVPRLFKPQDLLRSHDIEDFISTYLMPRYGAGEYEVAVIDGDNKETDQQTVSVLPATTPDERTNPEGHKLGQVVDKLFDKIHDLESRLTGGTKEKTLGEQIEEMQKLKQSLGGNDMLTLMLLLRQSQPEHSSEIAEMRRAIAGLREEMRGYATATPPGGLHDLSEPRESTSDLIDKIGALMHREPAARERDPIELLRAAKDVLGNPEHDAMRDLKDEIKSIRDAAPKSSLGETIDVIDKVVQRFGGGSGSTGDKVLQGLEMLTDPERIEAMGRAVHTWRESLSGRSAKAPLDPKTKKFALPGGFESYLKAMRETKDDESMIKASMRALEFLGKHTSWQGSVLAMAKACTDDDEKGALAYANSFIEGLRGAGRLDRQTAKRASQAFKKHIASVMETVAEATRSRETD